MKYVFKGVVRSLLLDPLLAIIYSLITTVLVWFFGTVIFGAKVDFVLVWKWTYVFWLGVMYLLEVVYAPLSRWVVGKHYSHQYNAEFEVVMKAFWEDKIVTVKNGKNLTPEEFKKKVDEKEALRIMVDNILKKIN